LKRYRQAVLKYAFEGKLTEEWRKTHRDQIEPATKLLERLREVKKDTKFKELPPIDTVDLPILPEEWTWTRIGEIAESMRNGVYKPKEFYGNNGVACLRMYNIENGAIAWKDVKRMNLTPEEIEFYELKPSDILVNRVNSRELVGKAAAIPVGLERCVYESKNIRLRLLQDYANSKYVSFWFLVHSQKFFSRNAQQTVGMASINQEQLALMPIPLCHPSEQTKAVEEIERLFSIADEVEKIATESIEQTDKMRQSILKMAFEGKIVPQDPGDEPANKLLERIREERAKSKGEQDAKRRMKNKPRQLELSGYVE
jgi:type I restriction enzyme S subunit